MEHLSDELLLESFYEANKLNLSPDFISLITQEINRRSLDHKIKDYKQ
jgi:developmental checkpoint coupling sporulation initiation to replication initiation